MGILRAFIEGDFSTRFIEEHAALLFGKSSADEPGELALASLYLLLARLRDAGLRARQSGDPFSPWHSHSGWRMNEPHCHQLALSYLGREVDVAAEQLGPRRYRLTFEENSLEVSGTLSGEELSADKSVCNQVKTGGE